MIVAEERQPYRTNLSQPFFRFSNLNLLPCPVGVL
jgi:hypothetical protein